MDHLTFDQAHDVPRDAEPPPPSPNAMRPDHRPTGPPLHQLALARQRQGLSVRAVAKRLGTSTADVRRQEDEQCDLRLSELYAWQVALEVPLIEMLSEPADALSPQVLDRARMLKMMKTVQALLAKSTSNSQRRLCETLVAQLLDLMPELRTVSAWPSVGQRRTSEELGRIEENPISESWIRDAMRFGSAS